MVNAVNRRRIENFIQPAQFGDPFGMHPMLILRDEHQSHDCLKWTEANQDHWDQKRPLKKAFHQAQAKPNSKVVVVRAVMNAVTGPKDAVFMLKAMHPIICEVRSQ